MNRFRALPTNIEGLLILDRQPITDPRGLFERIFCAEDLTEFGHPGILAQANRSVTEQRGAVRGMHFQHSPHEEWKLISCTHGAVHDVIVDIRRHSPTFLSHVAIELIAERHQSLLVPPGMAHGFQTLVKHCEMLYFHSHPFMPQAEGGLLVEDPKLNISWPLPISCLSERDRQHPPLDDHFAGVSL